jgi:hypothetical protein
VGPSEPVGAKSASHRGCRIRELSGLRLNREPAQEIDATLRVPLLAAAAQHIAQLGELRANVFIQGLRETLGKIQPKQRIQESADSLKASFDRVRQVQCAVSIDAFQSEPHRQPNQFHELPDHSLAGLDFCHDSLRSHPSVADVLIHHDQAADVARDSIDCVIRQMRPRPPSLILGVGAIQEKVGYLRSGDARNCKLCAKRNHNPGSGNCSLAENAAETNQFRLKGKRLSFNRLANANCLGIRNSFYRCRQGFRTQTAPLPGENRSSRFD